MYWSVVDFTRVLPIFNTVSPMLTTRASQCATDSSHWRHNYKHCLVCIIAMDYKALIRQENDVYHINIASGAGNSCVASFVSSVVWHQANNTVRLTGGKHA